MPTITELAETIESLDPEQQAELLKKVAELNFQRGLEALSRRYRERLAIEGALEQSAEEILSSLKEIREHIASNDYHL
ncbi:MAG: hypothetical protein L0177_05295 [Chloroflexi bacterium]|nr:hypothetical protein [Chloroflexota bacterium]